MKTIAALLASIINAIGLINTVINVAQQSTTNVGDAVIDASEMVKMGVRTAKISFDMENTKSLELLNEELNSSPTTEKATNSSQSTNSTN